MKKIFVGNFSFNTTEADLVIWARIRAVDTR